MNAITDPKAIVAELNRRLMGRKFSAYSFPPRLPRVSCADGFEVSIQACSGTYCTPRDNTGPWTSAECGFPAAPMPELGEYVDGPDINAIDTVWGYVPLVRIAKVLIAHGGLMSAGAAQ